MEEVKIVLSQQRTEEEALEELARAFLMMVRDLPESRSRETENNDHA